MKKLTLAIALFAFVGTASVNAAVVKHEGEKTEKAEKAEKKEKKDKKTKACTPGAEGTKSCCKKKEAKA
jgi:Ni/Co efflux regulator RcnB